MGSATCKGGTHLALLEDLEQVYPDSLYLSPSIYAEFSQKALWAILSIFDFSM